jgi:Secretion system C-terminal sorting domain
MQRAIGLFFTVFFFCGTIHSQISLTRSQAQLDNTVGTTSTSYFDSTTTIADIGNTGQSSWDFSSLTPSWSYTTTCIDLSSSPYSGSFPNSTICRKYTVSIMGFQSDNWLFNSLDDNGFYLDGNVTATQIIGFSSATTTTYTPSEKQLKFPFTYGTSWTQDYSYSTASSTGGPTVTTNVHLVNTVDAYGSLVLPGGTTVQALRMKREERSTTTSMVGQTSAHFIGYVFYTELGSSISVAAADTLQADHGVINVSGAGWVVGNVTGIKKINNSSPTRFELSQNYPNPFNPTTTIRYQLPNNNLVTLKVYDVLGKELRTLVNEVQNIGSYEVTFDGNGLSSGIYFYRLVAGTYSETKKLVLMK